MKAISDNEYFGAFKVGFFILGNSIIKNLLFLIVIVL